jgi:CBS domain-containing protein
MQVATSMIDFSEWFETKRCIMKIDSIYTPGAITATPATTLGLIAGMMKAHNVGAVVIQEEHRPVGIITDRDLAMAFGLHGRSIHTHASEVMTPHVLAIPQDTDILTATQFMRERRVRRLPVVDAEDKLVGMVTMDNLLSKLGREMANLTETIQDEIHVR